MARDREGPNPWAPEEPRRRYGKAPVVGQSSSYVAGANAHGKREKRAQRRGAPERMPMAGPDRFTHDD
jgi:hypothetical protein